MHKIASMLLKVTLNEQPLQFKDVRMRVHMEPTHLTTMLCRYGSNGGNGNEGNNRINGKSIQLKQFLWKQLTIQPITKVTQKINQIKFHSLMMRWNKWIEMERIQNPT